jgi:hypothetical protein
VSSWYAALAADPHSLIWPDDRADPMTALTG